MTIWFLKINLGVLVLADSEFIRDVLLGHYYFV